MAPKMLQKSSSGAGGLRESLGERFWEGPRGSPEAPESAPGAPGEPQEVQNEHQEAPNDPQEAEKEPQEGQSELWEASGSVLGRISDAFPSNARRPRRSLLKPPARARSARARLQAGAAARMRTHGCASWCFALLLLAVACARLLVFSVACDACGSRFSRASRSSIARFPFLVSFSSLSIFRKMPHPPHENLVF